MIAVRQVTQMTGFAVAPSLTFAEANLAGSVLVCMFYISTSVTPTVTDSAGNTWVQVGTSQESNSGASFLFTFVCLNANASASNEVTVNSATTGAIALLLEATGFSNPIAENWTGKLGSIGTDTTPTITPSAANSLVCAMAQPDGFTGCTISSPFIGGNSGDGSFSQGGYDILTSVAATDAEFTGLSESSNGLIIFDITSNPVAPGTATNVCIMT